MADNQRIKILFVDDEPHILQGLQRMLHPLRKEWDMTFVEGAEKALAFLKEEPVDIMVTDMKMPVMDGIQLLSLVRDQFPQVIRIVLSGYSDYQMILNSVPLAHQFLIKPCDPKSLVSAVNRAGSLRDVLTNPALKKMVARISSLPSLPALYVELEQAITNGTTNLNTISDIIAQDIAMTAKVLQIVNSAFFGLPRKINNPEEAVLMIGLKTLQAMILSAHIFSEFKNHTRFKIFLDQLWSHSQAVSTLAKSIATQEKGEKILQEYASIAGLLHDCGKLILADNFPEEFEQTLALAGEAGIASWEAEERIFGTHHGVVGAYLMGIWGLPNPIIEALAFHHRPHSFAQDQCTVLTAVFFADVLENEMTVGDHLENMVNESLSALDLNHRFPIWRKLAKALKEKREKP